jgi:hypothetical protein
VILRSILSKDLAGWEVMELLAGSMSESDRVFNVRTCAACSHSSSTLTMSPINSNL